MRATDFCRLPLTIPSTQALGRSARVEPARRVRTLHDVPTRFGRRPRDRVGIVLQHRRPTTLLGCLRRSKSQRKTRGPSVVVTAEIACLRTSVKSSARPRPETPSIAKGPPRAFAEGRRCAPLLVSRVSFHSPRLSPFRARPPSPRGFPRSVRGPTAPDDFCSTDSLPGHVHSSARSSPSDWDHQLPGCPPHTSSESTVTRISDCEPRRRARGFGPRASRIRRLRDAFERGAFRGPRGLEQGSRKRPSPPRDHGGTPRRLRPALATSWRLATRGP